MSDNPDPVDRQLALLRQLAGRKIARASEFFAGPESPHGAADSHGAPQAPARHASTSFETLFPDAACLRSADGGPGCCRIVRTCAPVDGTLTRQGYACPVGPWGGPPLPAALAELTGNEAWLAVDPLKIAYLDTETTNLAQGSGSYTFLIGLGFYERDAASATGLRFTVEQYFMEDYDGERALVDAVDAALNGAQALVSYNGLSFDLPLLEVRWRMQRRATRFPQLHLDLLHHARRMWKLRLASCSLGEVEKSILGIHRQSDVDGSWVPRIYFDYTRGIRPERIVPVFDHHAQDIYSLAALAAVVTRGYSQPDDERFAHTSDQWGLARLFAQRGRHAAAVERMECAVLAARDEDLGFRLAMHLARAYKRAGRLEDAVAIWRARLSQARADRLDPLIELAKHAEHAARDHDEALKWVGEALKLLDARAELVRLLGSAEEPAGGSKHDQAIAALRHRQARLDRRRRGAQAGNSRNPTRGMEPGP